MSPKASYRLSLLPTSLVEMTLKIGLPTLTGDTLPREPQEGGEVGNDVGLKSH